jgi:hypothetical protein
VAKPAAPASSPADNFAPQAPTENLLTMQKLARNGLPDAATIEQRAAELPPEAAVADKDVDKPRLSTGQKLGLVALEALGFMGGTSDSTAPDHVRLQGNEIQGWQGNGPIAVFDTGTSW